MNSYIYLVSSLKFESADDFILESFLLSLVWGETNTIVAEVENGAYGTQEWCSKHPNFRIAIIHVDWSPCIEIGPSKVVLGCIRSTILGWILYLNEIVEYYTSF